MLHNESLAIKTALPINTAIPFAEYMEYSSLIAYKDITSDATGGLNVFNDPLPFSIEIVGVTVLCSVTNGAGTVQLQTSAGVAISDAIIMATADNNTASTTIDIDTYHVAKGANLLVVTNGAADRGVVGIIFRVIEGV